MPKTGQIFFYVLCIYSLSCSVNAGSASGTFASAATGSEWMGEGAPAWQDLDADVSGCVTQVTFVF